MPAPKTYKNRFFDTLLTFKQYLRFLSGQGVTLPSYGTLLQWSNFISYTQGLAPRNLAAYYANDPSSIMLDSSGNVILWADSSGNSATNTLCLNGVAGNYASVPDSAALSVVGDLDLRAQIAPTDWTPTSDSRIMAKWLAAGSQRSYAFTLPTTGVLRLEQSTDGGGLTLFNSTVNLSTLPDNSTKWVRVTLDVDNGAAGRTVKFYTSDDGVNWVQLGTDVVQATAVNTFDGTGSLELGAFNVGTQPLTGRIYRAQVYSGIPVSEGGAGGTLVFDADFSKVSKLSSVFTEQSVNAAAVTVNTTGATGARIAGERDLYQGTAASRPAYTAAVNGNRLFMTFDGVDDYLKSPSFSLSQPESVYFVGRQITWATVDKLYDGNSTSSERMLLQQTSGGASPQLEINSGGTVGSDSDLSIGTMGIIIAIFNGAASSLRVNRGQSVVGNAGTNPGNGFTLAATANGTTNFGNIAASEIAIYAEAHNAAVQAINIGYFASKYGAISL